MPVFEYTCPEHGKFELLTNYREGVDLRLCPKCGKEAPKVEFSVPGKRNPEYGIQK